MTGNENYFGSDLGEGSIRLSPQPQNSGITQAKYAPAFPLNNSTEDDEILDKLERNLYSALEKSGVRTISEIDADKESRELTKEVDYLSKQIEGE